MKASVFVVGVVVAGVGGIAVQSASATLFDITTALNPVGYWDFETNNLTDHSGNGNDLTLYGNALVTGGGPAVAGSTNAGDLAFNAGGDGFYVDTPGGPGANALNLVGKTMSINLWVNMEDAAADAPHRTRQFVSKQRLPVWGNPNDDGVPWDYGLWAQQALDADNLPTLGFALNSYLYSPSCCAGTGFGHGNEAGELPPDALAIGEWHMISVSIDDGFYSYYYDGQFVVNGFNGGNPFEQQFGSADGGTPGYSRLWIGTHINENGHITGLMDEVSIFDTAISAAEVLSLFTGEIIPLRPGDFDLDGDVDGDDFLEWQTGFGTIYDGDDFLIWQQNFPTPGSGTGSDAVPEPTSLVLLVLLGLGAAVRRTKHG